MPKGVKARVRRASRKPESPPDRLHYPRRSLPVLQDSEIRAREMVTHLWRLVSVTHGGRRMVVSVAGKLRLQGMRVRDSW
jgi:hypothetical protein